MHPLKGFKYNHFSCHKPDTFAIDNTDNDFGDASLFHNSLFRDTANGQPKRKTERKKIKFFFASKKKMKNPNNQTVKEIVYNSISHSRYSHLIGQLFTNRSLEETLASFTTNSTVMSPRSPITTHQTQFDAHVVVRCIYVDVMIGFVFHFNLLLCGIIRIFVIIGRLQCIVFDFDLTISKPFVGQTIAPGIRWEFHYSLYRLRMDIVSLSRVRVDYNWSINKQTNTIGIGWMRGFKVKLLAQLLHRYPNFHAVIFK